MQQSITWSINPEQSESMEYSAIAQTCLEALLVFIASLKCVVDWRWPVLIIQTWITGSFPLIHLLGKPCATVRRNSNVLQFPSVRLSQDLRILNGIWPNPGNFIPHWFCLSWAFYFYFFISKSVPSKSPQDQALKSVPMSPDPLLESCSLRVWYFSKHRLIKNFWLYFETIFSF